MTNTARFARNPDSKAPRGLRFIRELEETHAAHLHDHLKAPAFTAPKADPWTTQRLRPEVMATVAALKARYAKTHGTTLTASEVIAAALTLAMPILTRGSFCR